MTQEPPPAATPQRPARRRKKPTKAPAVAYEFAEPTAWADSVAHLDQIVTGTAVTLYGKCPRCTHQMSVELPLSPQTVVIGKRDREAVEAASPLEVRRSTRGLKTDPTYAKAARCNCGMAHLERPEDVSSGCGAFGLLEVWVR